MEASFPTLLSRKAALLGRFTRVDLVTFGMALMCAGYFKVSGFTMIACGGMALFLGRYFRDSYPSKFVSHIFDGRQKSWAYKIGELRDDF